MGGAHLYPLPILLVPLLLLIIIYYWIHQRSSLPLAIPLGPTDSTISMCTILSCPLRPPRNFRCFQGGMQAICPKYPNIWRLLAYLLFILPGNLLAYESISQPRKPKGVRSQFSLRLPTLSDNIR